MAAIRTATDAEGGTGPMILRFVVFIAIGVMGLIVVRLRRQRKERADAPR
jgi:hypothetical protein